MFILGMVSRHPPCSYAPYICTPLMFICPPRNVHTTHMATILLWASVCSHRLLHVVGGCKGPITCWTPPLHLPLYGCLPFGYTPTYSLASLCINTFWGYMYVIWGFFPFVGGLEVFPICWGFWGHQHMGCPYAYSCTFCSSLCLTFLL